MAKFTEKLLKILACSIIAIFLLPTLASAKPQEDIILMSINDDEYVSETTTPILMSLGPQSSAEPSIIVPGDTLIGKLNVMNNGPGKGVLQAYLVNIENNGPDDLSMDDWFSGDVQISANNQKGSLIQWDTSDNGGQAKSIDGTDHTGVMILEEELEKGETSNIQLQVEFPVEAVSGNSAGNNASPNNVPNDYSPGKRSTSFYIYLTLSGDVKNTPNPDNPTNPPNIDDSDDKNTGSDVDSKDNDHNNNPVQHDNSGNRNNTGNEDSSSQENATDEEDRNFPNSIITGAEIVASPVGIISIVIIGLLTIGFVFIRLGKRKQKVIENEVE